MWKAQKNKEHIKDFSFNGINMSLYYGDPEISTSEYKDKIYAIDSKEENILASFSVQKFNSGSGKGAILGDIISSKGTNGLAYYILNNILLDMFTYIICDGERTPSGKKFTFRMINDYLSQPNKYKIFVIDYNNGEYIFPKNVEEFKKWLLGKGVIL